jgi:hypothetical protein
MSEFHDPELRQQLGRLSGPYPDANVAFAAWQRRVGQARRRRAVAWTTGAMMSLVIATVAFAAVQNPGTHSLVPGKSFESSTEVSSSIATTEAAETSSSASSVAETMAPVPEVAETTQSSEVAKSSTPEAPPVGAPVVAAAGTQPSGTSKNHGGPPSTPASARPQITTATQVVKSMGGSVTVRQDGDKLTIIGMHEAPGFKGHETDHSGDQVAAIFTSKTHRSEITVKLSDGVIKADVVEKSADTHGESIPADTSGGDRTGGDNG